MNKKNLFLIILTIILGTNKINASEITIINFNDYYRKQSPFLIGQTPYILKKTSEIFNNISNNQNTKTENSKKIIQNLKENLRYLWSRTIFWAGKGATKEEIKLASKFSFDFYKYLTTIPAQSKTETFLQMPNNIKPLILFEKNQNFNLSNKYPFQIIPIDESTFEIHSLENNIQNNYSTNDIKKLKKEFKTLPDKEKIIVLIGWIAYELVFDFYKESNLQTITKTKIIIKK